MTQRLYGTWVIYNDFHVKGISCVVYQKLQYFFWVAKHIKVSYK